MWRTPSPPGSWPTSTDPTRACPEFVEIVGDPRLQLGDRIRITDPDGLALNGHYWIVGIRDTFSRSGYCQQITVRRAATLLAWDTGVWDTNTWG